jgi:hypothetical protein
MSGGIFRLIVVPVAVLVATASASASPAFKGNVCALLTAKQVTAINGVTARCKNKPTLPGLGSKIYEGDWMGATSKSPTLQVTLAVYSDSGALKLADHNLEQGLPGGTPQKVTGIGDAAYEAKGAFEAGIHVAVGKYIAYISLGEIGKTPSPALIEPVAKDVAAKLS